MTRLFPHAFIGMFAIGLISCTEVINSVATGDVSQDSNQASSQDQGVAVSQGTDVDQESSVIGSPATDRDDGNAGGQTGNSGDGGSSNPSDGASTNPPTSNPIDDDSNIDDSGGSPGGVGMVDNGPNISVAIALARGPVASTGEFSTVTMAVGNHDAGTYSSLRLTFNFPVAHRDRSVCELGVSGGCTGGGSGCNNTCLTGDFPYFEIPELAPGEVWLNTFTIDPQLPDGRSTQVAPINIDLTLNELPITTASDRILIREELDWDLSMEPVNRFVAANGIADYSISAVNLTNEPANQSRIVVVPAVGLVDLVPFDGGVVQDDGTIVWELGSVSAGDIRDVSFTARVSEELVPGQLLTSEATVESDGGSAVSRTILIVSP